MSTETMEWLNTMCLIGYTTKRGNAWHYRESNQGGEPNHYPEAIPVADVERRLFNWQMEERPLYIVVPCDVSEATTMLPDGSPARHVAIENRKAIVRNDTSSVLGIFKGGYQIHQYQEWLIENVSMLVGGSLNIGSAGLLKGGAVAWLMVEELESVTLPNGEIIRPNLVAATSADGSLSTQWAVTFGRPVCDNTLATGLLSALATYKVKHTKFSMALKATEVRDTLGIIQEATEQFTEEVEVLTNWAVTDDDWRKFLDEVCKFDADAKTTRSATIATAKRDDLQNLWDNDLRVTPFRGTAYGVLQATNTWAHHLQTVRGTNRAERNMLNAITGATAKADADTIKVLQLVTA